MKLQWTVLFMMMVCLMMATPMIWAQTENTTGESPRLRINDPLSGSITSRETTLSDQKDVAVTVYNNGRALVRDRREIPLLPGTVALQFSDVAEQVRPETVSLRSMNDPGRLFILEQNYEYDLMSPQKLMEKYVGKEVRLINKHEDYDFYEQPARLLSMNNGPVYEINGDIYLDHPGTVVLPEIPDDLIARPSLIWLLDNQGTDHDVEVTYMTGGMSWKADYVLSLNREETAMDVTGWVTLTNQSGATYTNAELKLVAGDVNIVRDQPERMMRMDRAVMAEAAMAPPPMQQEAFAEYHLYTLPRRTTIRQNQNKQVNLLNAANVAVKKVYEYRGNTQFFFQRMPDIPSERAAVMLTFENREVNQLGIPLPGGIMRVYQEDSSGALQFSGEDRIQHTPRNEEVRLRLGNAFDVVAERKQTEYDIIASNVHESSFEIVLRNHKDNDIVVDVIETLTSDWQIRNASHEHQQRDAFTVVFPVDVPANGEATVTYTVRIRYR